MSEHRYLKRSEILKKDDEYEYSTDATLWGWGSVGPEWFGCRKGDIFFGDTRVRRKKE